MRAVSRDQAFGGHAGVSDRVGTRHERKPEACGDIGGQPNFLVQLHAQPFADDCDFRRLFAQLSANLGRARLWDVQNGMGVVNGGCHAQLGGKVVEIGTR